VKLYRSCGKDAKRAVLLFGGGLVGSAIADALERQGLWALETIRWDWIDSEQRQRQAAAFVDNLTACERIDVVWAAGTSGFPSIPEQMAQEAAHVAEVLDLTARLRQRASSAVFHLFSSLGGLFEGQSWIDNDSQPFVHRPYGDGKAKQEAMVRAMQPDVVARIYRPSSVYGYTPRGRRGLFSAIIASILTSRPAVIFGSPHTIRDYVLAADIGDFVAQELGREAIGERVHIVASGKPTSLIEAIGIIEDELGRRYYGRFDKAPHNTLDMTVRVSALPPDLRRTSLRFGISLVHQSMMRNLILKSNEA